MDRSSIVNMSALIPAFVALDRRDLWLASLTLATSLTVFVATTAPSVAAGDVAELQYIPARLGIPHPNGYPFYLFLGWLWSRLPVGTLAWRMNLLSAVLGAGCVGLVYVLFRIVGMHRIPALSGALSWAFQRTFWIYTGLAHRYTLFMLLGVAFLLAMSLWRRYGQAHLLMLAALLAGLGLASHIAAPLFFLPGFVLLAWPGYTRWPAFKLVGLATFLGLFPLLLYVYIPLRGIALWNVSPFDEIYGVPLVVLQGLIHPRFAPDATTLWHYFTAGSPVNLNELFSRAVGNTWFVPVLIRQEMGALWLALAFSGLLLALWRDRAWGVAMWLLLVVNVVLALYYRQGNVEAYFLPAVFVLVTGLTEVLNAAVRLVTGMTSRRWLVNSAGLVALVLPLVFFERNIEAANHRGEVAMDRYWRNVLALELEPGAGLLAHWSDLTPLWYFQQAERQRPDLLGLYLSDLGHIQTSLRRGNAIYLAGPLYNWYGDLRGELRQIPWGPLVRLALPSDRVPTVEHKGAAINISLANTIALRTVILPAEPVLSGVTVPITLTWTSLGPVASDLHISLRLREQGRLMAQVDDRIISPWYAMAEVEPGLDFWSQHYFPIPEGLRPGKYELRAVVYEPGGRELLPTGGGIEVVLRDLEVIVSPSTKSLGVPAVMLTPCLALRSAAPDVNVALIGASVGVDFLWEAHCQTTSDVWLRFFLEHTTGRRELDHQPLDNAYPPSRWQFGQRVLTRSQLRLPVDLPPGQVNLSVEAFDPVTGQAYGRHWGPIPLSGPTKVGTISVAIRPYKTEAPTLKYDSNASFNGQIRLLGYDIANHAIVTGSPLTVTVAWQAEQIMETDYSVFLHLLNWEGRIIAQRDMPPGGPELPTSVWLPGEVVLHEYVLQPDHPLQPGIYHLILGIYDPVSWQRLRLVGTGEDHVRLQTIRVD